MSDSYQNDNIRVYSSIIFNYFKIIILLFFFVFVFEFKNLWLISIANQSSEPRTHTIIVKEGNGALYL